jgi:hypothetical protein
VPNPVAQELLLIVGGLVVFVFTMAYFGVGWAIVVSVMAAGGAGALRDQASARAVHHAAVPNYEKRYLHVGLLILLVAAFLVFLPIASSDAFRERLAVLNTPKPSDCDWASAPIGDKHCHYESSVSHVRDRTGKEIIVTWQRVDD